MATNFVGKIEAQSTELSSHAMLDSGLRQEMQVLRWTQANQLTDQFTVIN